MLSLIPKFALWPFVRQVAQSKGLTAIAVGAGGTIARTTDGTNWTEPASTVTSLLHQAAYGNGAWMIVGLSYTVLLSMDDGVTWSQLTLPTTGAFNGVPLSSASIVYDNGRFVIITSNQQVIYTADLGVTWVRQNFSGQNFNNFKKGKARRLSDGIIYQPGCGTGGKGYATFQWGGTAYVMGETLPTSGSSYIVQSMITEGNTYQTSQQQGGSLYRKKPSDTSWEQTRIGVSTDLLVEGSAGYDNATDTYFQMGNSNGSSGVPTIFKGVAGANWQSIDTTMFGTNHLLSDCGYVDKKSIIVGSKDVFFSADWQTWNKVYAAAGSLNSVTVRARFTAIGDFNRWRHLSFSTNEPIDDVTEKFAIITGAPTFTNNCLNTTAGAQYARLRDGILVAASEDFTYSFVITPTATLSAAAITTDVFIAGSNESTGAFYIIYGKNFNKFVFYVKINNTFIGMVPSADVVVAAGADMHIEFSRKGDIFNVFLNGVKQTVSQPTVAAGAPALGAPQPVNLAGFPIGSLSSSAPFKGKVRNVFFDKGVCRHTESFAPDTTLQVYTRPLYNADDAKLIRTQIGFRRDQVIDEANERVVFNSGVNQVVQQGRMKFSGTQSSTNGLTVLVDPFGAADFTIECCFNTSAVGATAGFLLMAEWWLGSATNDLNRWALLIASNRTAYFTMARSTVGTDTISVAGTVALALNTDYKIIIERVAGVLNLYVIDPYTGVQVDKQSIPCTIPMRGAAPRWVRNYSQGTSNYGGTGYVWDIRIADKAMYNGVPTISGTFPGFPEDKYTATEEALVVTQATFSRSPRDEKLGTLVTVPAANGSVYLGVVSTNGAFAWSGVTPAFSSGDFTIEGQFVLNGISGNPISIFGQYLNSASNSSWQIRLMDGKLGVVFSTTGDPLNNLLVLVDTVSMVVGQEYFVVVERVGTTVTLYIDGVAKATATFSGVLPATTLPIQRGGIGTSSLNLRNVRVSKTSQYKGQVPKFPQFKRLSAVKPSITMGFFQGDVGTLYGYMENSSYSVSSGNGAYISLGSCTHKLFRFNKSGTIIVRRLKGLFMDRGSYLILGWEDTTLTPTSDMLMWTNTIVINGVSFTNNGQLVSGFTTPLGGTSIYWSGVSAMNPLLEGREIAFEFI